jgi:hypothetical protein
MPSGFNIATADGKEVTPHGDCKNFMPQVTAIASKLELVSAT